MPARKNTGPVEFSVYALCEIGAIRYIGITVKPLDLRLREHVWSAWRWERTYRACWIRSLWPREPSIVLLEITTDPKRESYWIDYYRKRGCRLTNLTNGGDSYAGRNFTPEHRAHLSAALKGKPVSEETRRKLREAHLGKTHTEESRAKIGDVVRGRKHKPETKAKIAAKHVGMKHTTESREKLSATRKALFANGVLKSPTKGKHLSVETRERIRQALLERAARLKRN